MPYLNWKDQSPSRLQQEIVPLQGAERPESESMQPGRGDKLRMTLSFDGELLGTLLPLLREAFDTQSRGELRLDLPRKWIVFWKIREGESRLLLAHPQTDEWVATVALSVEHGALLVKKLEALVSGQSVSLGELAATGSVSNLELTLAHL